MEPEMVAFLLDPSEEVDVFNLAAVIVDGLKG
jgi:hypothetical protein